MEHVWTVLCRLSLTEAERHTISLIEALETIQLGRSGVEAPQILAPPLELISLWWRSDLERPEQHRARIVVVAPSGAVLDGVAVDIDLRERARVRTLATFDEVPYAGDGVYRFFTQVHDSSADTWITVAATPLHVTGPP